MNPYQQYGYPPPGYTQPHQQHPQQQHHQPVRHQPQQFHHHHHPNSQHSQQQRTLQQPPPPLFPQQQIQLQHPSQPQHVRYQQPRSVSLTHLPPIQSSMGPGGVSMQSIPPPHSFMPNTSTGSAIPMHNPHGGMNYSIAPGQPNNDLPEPPMPPVPLSHTSRDDKYEYSLVVAQEPQRARMCGFGDKDRRPITPPPCVRVVIKDIATGREIDYNELDGNHFVLQVDLWSDNARHEMNVVRTATTSPAITIAGVTTPAHIAERIILGHPSTHPHAFPPQRDVHGQPLYRNGVPGFYASPIVNMQAQQYRAHNQTHPNPMSTKNLIGSLAVTASKLKDDKDKLGWFFVLQDLSVRTEGFFRLKMKFVDVGDKSGSGLKRIAPTLAWVFSDKFQVYSAKKFPGVIESTPLSKRFASQGIKIPIRKDVKNEQHDDDDDNEDEDDDDRAET